MKVFLMLSHDLGPAIRFKNENAFGWETRRFYLVVLDQQHRLLSRRIPGRSHWGHRFNDILCFSRLTLYFDMTYEKLQSLYYLYFFSNKFVWKPLLN